MRSLLVLGFVLGTIASCGHRSEGDATAITTGGSDDDNAEREQQRFDAERRPDKIVEALAIGPGAWVADIGANSGLLTVHLARAVAPNGRVVATDVDGAVLEYLARKLKKAGLSQVVEPRVVGADHPELEDGAYDAILLAQVDHLFDKPAVWLAEAVKALKPGGRIVISNRLYHRAAAMAAAKKAGLVLRSESTPVTGHYIAVFVVAK